MSGGVKRTLSGINLEAFIFMLKIVLLGFIVTARGLERAFLVNFVTVPTIPMKIIIKLLDNYHLYHNNDN